MFKVTIIIVALGCVVALPNPDNAEAKSDKTRALKKECANGILNPTCLKIGAISLIEKLNTKEELALIPGVSLVRDGEGNPKFESVTAELARSLSSEPDERLDKFLLYNVGTFLDTHSVKLKLADASAVEEARSLVSEGRGDKGGMGMGGKKGGMGGLMAMAMMMKGMFNFVQIFGEYKLITLKLQK
ncbi:uncharacterized protein LOC115452902 [Manduca sexta]|uniref:uncharacterized protein LOC115452902 n=1 Tax=Manduca sexta TaxID=7130 RepID=UPI001182B23D|nr:uncharacterized protein LOC115452902 [Manduca sexta]